MRVKVRRFVGGEYKLEEFEVPAEDNPTVLELLYRIRENFDPTLSFRAMCRASICGTCAVKVNGEHRLACNTRVSGDEVLIEPVDNSAPVKDLVVSHDPLVDRLKRGRAWLIPKEKSTAVKPGDVRKLSKAWDCILCDICNNVCPPLAEGKDFGGPMLLTRLYRIVEDVRDGEGEKRLEEINSLNLQLCVHCSNCNIYCPKGCIPERWITVLEGKLVQKGYIQKKTEDFGFLGF